MIEKLITVKETHAIRKYDATDQVEMSLTVTVSSKILTIFLKHHSWISGYQVHPAATAAAHVKVYLTLGQAWYTFHQYWYVKKGKMHLLFTMDIYAYGTAAILGITQIHN